MYPHDFCIFPLYSKSTCTEVCGIRLDSVATGIKDDLNKSPFLATDAPQTRLDVSQFPTARGGPPSTIPSTGQLRHTPCVRGSLGLKVKMQC